MSILLKFIYRFNSIPIKIPAEYFVKIELIVNFIYKYKESRVVNKILKRRTKLEDLHDLISRLIYSLLARQFILV